MAVGFGEDESLGYFEIAILVKTVGEDLRQPVSECTNHCTDLIRIDNFFIKLPGGILFVFILEFVSFFAGK
ncbi:MAG: hypothetical protein A4E53_00340 [Pelotomaculum sp. PtaB.Bin104]|nr:MAG: hypothetical protein A4E53_00340 [Pelotomaculum sp. PtaB.Bin104]